ncbi:hypothetical protein A3Q56_00231 [Intoshia linei]|uniref:UMP-CMP kinase n=1 Tax=Intoshia linei TaxID=1819745 RepID=A0A177BCM5_9BILA|nr:hypothetical protein A3Q56_00231 [Intoshia linei]
MDLNFLNVKKYNYIHLSAGDLLRAEMKKTQSKYKDLISGHIVNGTIVPVEITCNLLKIAMEQFNEKNNQKNFLIDGFPRNQDNIDGWNKVMNEVSNVQAILLLDCDEETCVNRCLKRGQLGSGRSDDNAESLRQRIITYENQTKIVVKHYTSQNLVKSIDATGNIKEVNNLVDIIFKILSAKD